VPILHYKLVVESFYPDVLSSQRRAHEVAMATVVEAALWVEFEPFPTQCTDPVKICGSDNGLYFNRTIFLVSVF
jgi:hypothetical protein